MKSIISFILLSFIGTSLFAQINFNKQALIPTYSEIRCDSVLNYISNGAVVKYTNTFDINGAPLSKQSQHKYPGSNVWENQHDTTYTYDALRNLATKCYHIWKPESEEWRCTRKFSYTYDESNNLSFIIHQDWNSTINGLVNVMKGTYLYDELNRPIEMSTAIWDDDENIWENHQMLQHNYDPDGNLITEINHFWNEDINNWKPYRIDTYTYDSTANLLTKVYQKWDYQYETWMNKTRDNFIYDDPGNLIQEFSQEWEEQDSLWINHYNESYAYDEYGNRISLISQGWDDETNVWENSWKREYNFDTTGQLMLNFTHHIWDPDDELWRNGQRRVYSYDGSNNVTSFVCQLWSNAIENWLNFCKQETDYDYTSQKIVANYYNWSDSWVKADGQIRIEMDGTILFTDGNYHETELYYSTPVSSIGKKNELTSQYFCFPNPANIFININNPFDTKAELIVYNISGRLLKNETLSIGEYRLPVGDLPKGIYIFTIQSKNQTISNKVMVD